MARTKNTIRLVTRFLRGADGLAPAPADVVAAVNRELCQDNVGMMFVTLFFGMLDPRTGEVRFTNAGHNPPYQLNGSEVAPVTACKGRPLGVRDNSAYETGTLQLAPGEAIYLYTDGVTEAANRNDELFTEERLKAALREAADRRSSTIINAVGQAVRSFIDGAPQSDDITALALRRVEPSSV
jgi:sigma-B regulation protein RsbU (phosphoserine phosphatase)